MYSFNRVDDLAHVVKAEVDFFDARDGQIVRPRDDASIVQALLQGRGSMPAWSEVLEDHAIADLLGFLRAGFGAP